MQVAHDISEFQDGEERILVLKDTGILDNEGNLNVNSKRYLTLL